MCRQVTCPQCGKPSWAGCGAHVEQVLRDVPTADRCNCAPTAQAPKVSWRQRRRNAKQANAS